MKSLQIHACVWLGLTLAGSHLSQASSPAFPSDFDVKGIDAFLSAQVTERRIPGLSIAILREGRVVLAKGYGKSSLKDNKPVTPDTRFAIGSVTKQFTCACILLLAEDGQLSVEDKVSKYFPDLTRANAITLLDLMNHVSGYPDYYPLDFVVRRMAQPITPDQLVREFAGGKLDFEPRSRYSYSNTGYVILGLVVEKVSGKQFEEFLDNRILKPLKLEHTSYDPEMSHAAFAQGYASFALGPAEPAVPEGRGWIVAAGALWSTASDLLKWNLALMDGKLLKPESYKLMTTPRTLADGRVSDYGCGLAIASRNGVAVLTHNGMVSGFNAHNSMIPSTRSAVVILSNSEFLTGSLHSKVLSLLTKSKEDLPIIDGLAAGDAAREFLGRLQNSRIDRRQLGEEFNVFLTPEKLRDAAKRLKPFGKPTGVNVERTSERGGMEVASIRFEFKGGKSLKALMYRTPDGKIQEFLITPE